MNNTTEHKNDIDALIKLVKLPYGDIAWLKPFNYGTFTWSQYIEARKEAKIKHSKENWPDSPIAVASVINHTLINEYGTINIQQFVERLNQECHIIGRPLTWKLGVFIASQHLRYPSELFNEKYVQQFLTIIARDSNSMSNRNIFEGLRRLDHNMLWLQHVAEMILSREHHDWCLNQYINMLDERDCYEINSNTGSGPTIMQYFHLANIKTITDYGLKKKDPFIITSAMLSKNMDVDEWANTIIAWLNQIAIGDNNKKKEDYKYQVRINILNGIKNMPPEQNRILVKLLDNNPTLLQKLQNAVNVPDNGDWRTWWRWNKALAKAGLINFKNPTSDVKQQLHVLEKFLKEQTITNRATLFNLGNNEDVDPVWMSEQHPILAKAAWEYILQQTYRNSITGSDFWNKLKTLDWSWLKNVAISETMVDIESYETPINTHGSQKHHLMLMTALIPKMNAKDKAYIAPLSAWVFGKTIVKSLSPQTFKETWAYLDSNYARPVPRQYKGDTYMLYGLTGRDATVLKGILDSLDLKDSATYLHITRQWMIANMPELAKDKTAEIQVDTSLF